MKPMLKFRKTYIEMPLQIFIWTTIYQTHSTSMDKDQVMSQPKTMYQNVVRSYLVLLAVSAVT